MKIAILGTGQVAQVLTPKLLAAGHAVVLGSRDPRQPSAWIAKQTGSPGVAAHDNAVAGSEIVINALPGAVAVETLSTLRNELTGKVVMDIANAIVPTEDGIALVYPNGSLAEELQKALSGAHVVKTMNTMSTLVMADPTGLSAPSSIFVSGDDDEAKRVVTRLLTELGWPGESIIDLGGLSTARGPEHVFQLLVPLFAWGTPRLLLATNDR
jgi:predicted dinucleotide-binding enzyme